MNSKRTLRQVAVALLLLVAFLFQGTWALAGTTGGVSGTVTDESGAPVAGAAVSFSSPSENATGKTDAGGHFSFLALAPDTYTVSVEKDGFNPVSISGVTVFADNNQQLAVHLTKVLKTIAKVTSTGAGALVKAGVGGDIYNVNSATIQASAALGGGNNLNSAYSAIASVPGVNVPIGGSGWNNNVAYIRGSQSFFTGYEYDGVPVNRAFDNYNASTESNLGLQELQVYTGGGPASNSSSGTSGFINQVIKTGTYPGYATIGGGLASSAFYHEAKVEAGGATPDRNFSYYIGISGYNQAFRFLDNSNGVGQMGQGGIYSDYSSVQNGLGEEIASANGALPLCDHTTGATPASVLAAISPYTNPGWGGKLDGSTPLAGFCNYAYTGISGLQSQIADRENVINFHFGIPRKNGQKDDVQALWSGSMIKTFYYGSINDVGGLNTYSLAQSGAPYQAPPPGNTLPIYNLGGLYTGNIPAQTGCLTNLWYGITGPGIPHCSYPSYADAWTYNTGFGTSLTGVSPSIYYSPDSPQNRPFQGQLPLNDEDAIYNDQGIVKLQYTHPMGDRAYARLSGYTFYSDWDQTGTNSANANYLYGTPAQALAANYLLLTHTTGGEFQFSDQVNDKNLLQFTANYTMANVMRDNNSGFTSNGALGQAAPVGLISGNAATGFTCYNPSTGNPYNNVANDGCANVLASSYGRKWSAAQVEGGFYVPAYGGAGTSGPSAPVGSPAQLAGAIFTNLWDGPTKGSYNTVDPKFLNVSLSDQFRPNDKWLFNGAVRYEDYRYDLPDSTTAADQFYGSIAANAFCYNTTPGAKGIYSAPLLPGSFPPASPLIVTPSVGNPTADCNVAILGTTTGPYVHPNGVTQDGNAAPAFTTTSPSSYNLHYWSARFSGTYTQSPETVWRFSMGRFVEPPISASTQYLDQSGNNTALWANFMGLGFFSPFHNVPAQTSGQYDVSLERHIRGTDMSFKISPFYNITNGYQEQSFIGAGFVTQVPVGRFRSYGIEGALTKGDFSKDGLSGSLSVTYTNAKVQFQSGLVNNNGANQIDIYNQAICEYDRLAAGTMPTYCTSNLKMTSDNFKCFAPGSDSGTNACTATDIANPYYAAPQQQLMDANGWYAPPSDVALPGVNSGLGLYDVPWISSLVLNYRHDKWAVTPSVQWNSGSSYGSPLTTQGVDPRLCTQLDASADAPANQCAYISLEGAGLTQTGLLYVPNWQTGTFDSIGTYRNPSILVGNIAFSYDVTPKISLNLTLANVFHTCFGGSKEPWTAAYGPGSTVCGYGANGLQVSNYQLGPGALTPGNSAAYSAADNGTTLFPWQFQSYAPTTGSAAGFNATPFNAYLTVNIKL